MKDKFVWSLISAVGIFCLGAGVTVIHGFHNLFVQQQLEHLAAGLTGSHSLRKTFAYRIWELPPQKGCLPSWLLAVQHVAIHCSDQGIHHKVLCRLQVNASVKVSSHTRGQAPCHACAHEAAS